MSHAQALPVEMSRDAKFVSAFLTGTMKTFQIQCNYEIAAKNSFLMDAKHDIKMDVCAVIGITSESSMGSIALCFRENMFLAVMGSMFGETFETVNDELSDGAGELMNIIFGTAKTILNESGFSLEKALPTVIRGKDITVSSLTKGGPTIVVPFQGKDGEFLILISLAPDKR